MSDNLLRVVGGTIIQEMYIFKEEICIDWLVYYMIEMDDARPLRSKHAVVRHQI